MLECSSWEGSGKAAYGVNFSWFWVTLSLAIHSCVTKIVYPEAKKMSSYSASALQINPGPLGTLPLDVFTREGNEGALGMAPVLVECGRFRKMVLPSHSYDPERVNCVLCNNGFGRRRDLTRHLQRVHFGWEILHFRAIDAETRFEALAQGFSDQLEKRVREKVEDLETRVSHLRSSFYKRFVEALESAGVTLTEKAAFAPPEGDGPDRLERAKLAAFDLQSQSRSFVRSVALAQDLEEKLVVANAALAREKARVSELECENLRLASYENECFSWRMQQKYQHQEWLRQQQEEKEERRQQEVKMTRSQPVQLQTQFNNVVENVRQEEVPQQPQSWSRSHPYEWSYQQPYEGYAQGYQSGWQQAPQQRQQYGYGDTGSYCANSSFVYQ